MIKSDGPPDGTGMGIRLFEESDLAKQLRSQPRHRLEKVAKRELPFRDTHRASDQSAFVSVV